MDWREHLQRLLQDAKPASVCTLDAAALELAQRALPDLAIEACREPTRCNLALGVDVLNGLPPAEAEHLISRVRTYSASRLLLVAQAECKLDDAGFRALGFVSLADAARNPRIYDYDLATYKSVPDWLNSRFWAHPERWEP